MADDSLPKRTRIDTTDEGAEEDNVDVDGDEVTAEAEADAVLEQELRNAQSELDKASSRADTKFERCTSPPSLMDTGKEVYRLDLLCMVHQSMTTSACSRPSSASPTGAQVRACALRE